MKTTTLLALAGLAGLVPATARAQSEHSAHTAPAQGETAATKAYRAANAKMHQNMEIKFSNDADTDFVRSMIAHHQGAIDMAKVVLQHGKDEQTRTWATDIIREQAREIAEMQAWLEKHGARP
jgi:uncharacterized protein (DUF305 family)